MRQFCRAHLEERRRAAIAEIFTEDSMFYDPKGGTHRGRDEIDRVAGAIKATHPAFQYEPIAGPDELGNAGRVTFLLLVRVESRRFEVHL